MGTRKPQQRISGVSVDSLNDKPRDEISAKTERVIEVESREAQELVHRLSYPTPDKSPTEKLNEEHKQRDEEIKKQIADAWSGLSKHGGEGLPPK
jgi:hypothetical protein